MTSVVIVTSQREIGIITEDDPIFPFESLMMSTYLLRLEFVESNRWIKIAPDLYNNSYAIDSTRGTSSTS